MGENKLNKHYKNFPVKVKALRVDWIMKDDGKKFLAKLAQSESAEMF